MSGRCRSAWSWVGFALTAILVVGCDQSQPALVAGSNESADPAPPPVVEQVEEIEETVFEWAAPEFPDVAGGVSAQRFTALGALLAPSILVTSDDMAFVGTGGGDLVAFDLLTGREQWRVPSIAGLPSSAITGLARLPQAIAATTGSALVSVSPDDGSFQWSLPLEGVIPGSVVTTQSGVYLGLDDGTLLAVNASDGTNRWTTRFTGVIAGNPTVFDGVVFGVTRSGDAFAVDALSGESIWELALPGEYEAGPSLLTSHSGANAAQPAFAVASVDGEVTIFDPTGARMGQFPSALSPVLESPSWISNRVLVSSGDGVLALYDRDGERLWDVELGDDLAGAPLVLPGVAIATDAAGALVSLDPEDGRVVSRAALPGIRTAATAWHDRGVAVVLRGGQIGTIDVGGATEQLALLAGSESQVLPANGAFRLQQQEVRLRLGSQRDAVFDITVDASPVEDLVLQIESEDGNVVATNMGKVALSRTVRVALTAGISYELVVTRPAPLGETVISVRTEEVL